MHLNGRPRQLRFISFSVWARFEPPGGENKKKTVANVEDVKKDANGRATRTKCCSFLFCGLLRRAKRPGEWDGGLSDMFRLPRPHRRGAGRALIFLFFLIFFFHFPGGSRRNNSHCKRNGGRCAAFPAPIACHSDIPRG